MAALAKKGLPNSELAEILGAPPAQIRRAAVQRLKDRFGLEPPITAKDARRADIGPQQSSEAAGLARLVNDKAPDPDEPNLSFCWEEKDG